MHGISRFFTAILFLTSERDCSATRRPPLSPACSDMRRLGQQELLSSPSLPFGKNRVKITRIPKAVCAGSYACRKKHTEAEKNYKNDPPDPGYPADAEEKRYGSGQGS